jgi:hypothetical protein
MAHLVSAERAENRRTWCLTAYLAIKWSQKSCAAGQATNPDRICGIFCRPEVAPRFPRGKQRQILDYSPRDAINAVRRTARAVDERMALPVPG